MDRRQLISLALGALAGAAAPQSAAELAPLHIVTSHLPPLVLEDGSDNPGALRELVDELAQRMRLQPVFQFVPWQRAQFLATHTTATAIFPLTRLPAREAQFRWLAPLFEESWVFLAPLDGRFDVRNPAQMKNSRIALLRGAAQASLLQQLGYRRIVEAKSIDEVHRFLVEGMADAAFGDRAIIQKSLNMRAAEHLFQLSAPLHSTIAWLAGSLDFSDKDAAQFQKAMAEMVADGTQRRILKKYGLA